MANTVSIATKHGNYNVDADLLQGYLSEANEHYEAIDEAKNELKLIGEALEEKTGIKASLIMKYAKARYDAKTGDVKETGEVFAALDNVVAG
jgi:hypothetical protein